MIDNPFVSMIYSLKHEMDSRYVPGCVEWANATMNNAWDKANDKFDESFYVSTLAEDEEMAMDAVTKFKETVIPYIEKYKQHKMKAWEA